MKVKLEVMEIERRFPFWTADRGRAESGHLSVFLVVRGSVIGLQLAHTITRPDEHVSRESTMKRFMNCIFTLVVAVLLVATWGCNKSETPSAAPGAAAAVDRTVLPLAEPNYP